MNNSSSSTESVNVLNLWLWKTNCLRSQSESEIVANIRLARLKIIHVYHHLLIIIDKTLYVHLRVSISRLAISSIKNIPFSSPYPRYAHRNAHDIYIYIPTHRCQKISSRCVINFQVVDSPPTHPVSTLRPKSVALSPNLATLKRTRLVSPIPTSGPTSFH